MHVLFTLVAGQTVTDDDLLPGVLCTGVGVLDLTCGSPRAHTGLAGLPDVASGVTIVTRITPVQKKIPVVNIM